MPSERKYKRSTLVQWIEDVVDPDLLSSDRSTVNRILEIRRVTVKHLVESERLIQTELAKIKMPWAKSVKFVPVEDETVIVQLKKDPLGIARIFISNNDENIEPDVLAIE